MFGQRAQPGLEALALGQFLLQRVGALGDCATQRAIPQQQAAHQQAGADRRRAEHALHFGALPPGDVRQRNPARDHRRPLGFADLREAFLQHPPEHRPVLAVAQRQCGEKPRLAGHAQAAEAVALDDVRRGGQVDRAGIDLAEHQVAQSLRSGVRFHQHHVRPGLVHEGLRRRTPIHRQPFAAHLGQVAGAVIAAAAQHDGGRADVGAGERDELLAPGRGSQRGQQVHLAVLEAVDVGEAVPGGDGLELQPRVRLHEVEHVGGQAAMLALAVDEAERREVALGRKQQHGMLGDPGLFFGREQRVGLRRGRIGHAGAREARQGRAHPRDDVTTIQCLPNSKERRVVDDSS